MSCWKWWFNNIVVVNELIYIDIIVEEESEAYPVPIAAAVNTVALTPTSSPCPIKPDLNPTLVNAQPHSTMQESSSSGKIFGG